MQVSIARTIQIAYLSELFLFYTRLNRLIGEQFILSIQDPIRINRLSEPEPDVAILRRREDFYADAHPTPEDVQLLIEVSDSSLPTDQKVKLPLYAAADIPQVWLIDLENERVLTYATPKDGAFQIENVYTNEDAISLAPLTEQSLSVKAIIG